MRNLWIATLALVASCIKYPLPEQTFTPFDICGEKKACTPGNVGVPFHFTKSPYSPDLSSDMSSVCGATVAAVGAETLQQLAYAVLGHVVSENDLTGQDITTCSTTVANPFVLGDVKEQTWNGGRSIAYNRREQLKFDLNASVEAGVDAVKKAFPGADVNDVKGKITAAYSRLSGKTIDAQGRYSEWALEASALDRLKKSDPSMLGCRKYLEGRRIITAVGIVNFDLKTDAESVDKIAADLDAALQASGVTYSLGASLKREVAVSLKAAGGVFQILVWRTARLEGDQLLN